MNRLGLHRITARAFVLSVGLLGCLMSAATESRAQFIGVDPYDPWNAMYRPFVFPNAPRQGSAIPNQSRIGSMGPGNSTFGSSDPFDTSSSNAGRSFGGRFTPYYLRSHRYTEPAESGSQGYSIGRERSHVANADDRFFADQQNREKRFFEALRERDPKRRAELLRNINAETRAATRSSSSLRSQQRSALPESDEPANEADTIPAPGVDPLMQGLDLPAAAGLPDPLSTGRQLPNFHPPARHAAPGTTGHHARTRHPYPNPRPPAPVPQPYQPRRNQSRPPPGRTACPSPLSQSPTGPGTKWSRLRQRWAGACPVCRRSFISRQAPRSPLSACR